jgi:DNA-binding NtrC family response regulator
LHNPNQPWLAPEEMSVLADRPLDWLSQAKGGLLFLREVGKLAPLQQKGLLLLLNRRNEYGVTVVCASSENLASLAAEGRYSRDLYNTLAQVAVRIPPLRERRQDIPGLAVAALRDVVAQRNLNNCHFSEAALERLAKHDWRGNLDELRSVVNNLAVTALDTVIDQNEIDALLGSKIQPDTGALGALFNLPLKEARDAFEKAYLESVLAECGGSMTKVAERSGLERTHLYRKLKQLGVKSTVRTDNS